MQPKEKPITKTALAHKLGVSRSSLYYKHKRPAVDEEVKRQIESVLTAHPSYGHKRIAIELKLNKKRILRVMKKFGIRPYRRRVKKLRKKADEGKPAVTYMNVYKSLCPIAPFVVWVSDFTYIRFGSYFIYLATIMDMYTREIVGWNISRFHNQELILGALKDAISRCNSKVAIYFHSDQGSEYDSQTTTTFVITLGMMVSMSDKASPWQNGFQESFYSQFKVDLGDPNRFEVLGELIEAIHLTINDYNTDRIHTTLKMSPENYRLRYFKNRNRIAV
ncbi:MAG: IS3 family transposase [Patescibacteria group bacterium]